MEAKIKVLLIDDNPELKKWIREIKQFKGHPDANLSMPYVFNDGPMGRGIDPNIRKRMAIVDEAFELKWLKSPKDIKNYLQLIKAITNQYGRQKAAEVGFVPDIIVFDYSLTTGMNETLKYSADILTFLNPNYKMDGFLKEEGVSIELAQRNVSHSIDIEQDTLGLFLSTIILEMFSQEHPCIGIPITYFKENLIGKDAEVFEWVVNEYYDKVMEWEGKGSKKWHEIIDFALPLYRDAFLKHVKHQKAQINPENLYDLLNSNTTGEELQNNYLIFSTIYGQRAIKLQYLFIDSNPFVDEVMPPYLEGKLDGKEFTNRDLAIYDFLNDLSKSLSKLANIGLGLNDFIEAKRIASVVYKHYTDHFEERIDLSDFTVRKKSLNQQESDLYTQLLNGRTFLVQKDEITSECSILSYRDSAKSGVLRLAILYLVANTSIELASLSNTSQQRLKYKPLEDEEIYYLLNPAANTARGHNLVLPMHLETRTQIRGILSDFAISVTRIWEKSHESTKSSDFYDFGTWISPGEKTILRSMLDVNPVLLPAWLR
jgi:hypothetical protein